MAIRRVLSAEDGNLEKSTLISSRTVDYVDIDLTLSKKPAGDIYKKRDAGSVKQAIKNLVLTNHYEKPFKPFFGSNLRGMLFELADDQTESEVSVNIASTIQRYEPRVEVMDIKVTSNPDRNDLSVYILFKIVSTEEIVTFTTNLSRLR